MKCRNLGHLQLLSRAVVLMTGMVEMEVSSQEEVANPQDIKVFIVEKHGLPEDSVSSRALYGMQSSPLCICAESCDCLRSATLVGTGRDSVFQLRVLLS